MISSKKVLSTAHCIHNKNSNRRNTKSILLLFGAYDLSDRNEIGDFIASPSEIFVHPEWNPYSIKFDADIAVILLDEEIPSTRFIKPICMATSDLKVNHGYIAGWGKSEGKTKPHENIPRQLKMPIVPNDI